MKIMQIDSLGWWIIVILNFVGYLILRFGIISNGTQKEVIKVFGTLLTTASFILMLIFYGFISSIVLMIILWVVVTPIIMIIINQLEKRLYPERIKIRREYVQKLDVTEEEVERISQMDDDEFSEEMRKKYKWLNNENKKGR